MSNTLIDRRRFVQFLVASPLLGALGSLASPGQLRAAQGLRGQSIESPDRAINVFDLEAVAAESLPPAHFGYIQTGVDGDLTLRANEEAFGHYYLRPRRLVDVSRIDTSVSLFGRTWHSPIALCPCGSQGAFDEDGEIASARAARSKDHLQILSTLSSKPIEDVVEARGEPIWFQLYPTGRWDITKRMLRRAEAAGCPVVVLTVDLPSGVNNRDSLKRAILRDARECSQCHTPGKRAPMFEGTDFEYTSFSQATLTWDFVKRLRDETSMKVLIKGIVTAEDAERCIEYGANGIVVSNHGGRADETGRAAIDSLAEVAPVVNRRVPVLMDSGIRRGNDIIKALALGADAVCIGRPYLWGLSAFGQAGVERALQILTDELKVGMEFAGTPSIKDINRSMIGTA